MEFESLESTAQVRQFLESCFEVEERMEDNTRRHGSSGSRLKMSDGGSLNRALQRASAGDRGLRVGVGKEKKVRRQIANSNERKRMQSINDGFQSLKALLPPTDCGEKLSKATILQHAANYIAALLDERKRLLAINTQCMLLIGRQSTAGSTLAPPSPTGPAHKRRKSVTESSDEGISLAANDYKPVRSRGRDVQASEVTRGVTERAGNKRLRRVTEEVSEIANSMIEPITSQIQPILTTSTAQNEPKISDTTQSFTDECHQMSCVSSTDTSKPLLFSPGAVEDVSTEQKCSDQQYSCLMSGDGCSVSRRNLETIVMAIRHLEGSNFISEELEDVEIKCEPMNTEIDQVPVSKPAIETTKETRSESNEAFAIKRKWQTKWEKGIQKSCRPEGVMKLKDCLLRKRQIEMEQQMLEERNQAKQEHSMSQQEFSIPQQEPSTPQQLKQDITLFSDSQRLFQHLISNTNNVSNIHSDSLAQRLHCEAVPSSDIKYEIISRGSTCPLTMTNCLIANEEHIRSSLPTIVEHPTNTSNCFPFYYTDRLTSSLYKPILMNVDNSDHLIGSVSR